MYEFENLTQDMSQRLLEGLNPEQAAAVQHDKGPLLVLAGAGSGKTRVITHRVAWLVSMLDVKPSSILAITFTNKAADEMKNRIEELIGPVSRYMWIGTFHAMLLRILRAHADLVGYERGFVILDSEDQQKLVKACLADLNLDEKIFTVRAVHGHISAAKNALQDWHRFTKLAGNDYFRSRVAQVYKCYQARLKQNNSMDFDDILQEAVRLLEENPEVLAKYQERFQYILVDEYQDTNHAQYRLVQLLAKNHQNLCVVGDDDQSIYSFRGANIQNILDFEKDFKKCKVIKLEQNYRSTGNVLKAANAVIGHNEGRKEKALWTDSADGEKITLLMAEDQHEEGRFIAREIERQVAKAKEKNYHDFAVLYRLNALSRSVEQALRETGIPYRIYGGTRFYDRREVKDVLAYLRLILMPADNISLARIINVPRRGIGNTTLEYLTEIAAATGLSMLDVCGKAMQFGQLQRTASRLVEFYHLIDRLRSGLDQEMPLDRYIDWVEEESGLVQDLLEQQARSGIADTVDRIENLKELLSDAVEFSNQVEQLQQDELAAELMADDELLKVESLPQMLQAFLEKAALYSEMDQDKGNDDVVRLLTIHSAKGLEFDTVFLTGAEDGLFPGYRSLGSKADYEEERRLAYVAITRARRKLFITTASARLLFGQTQRNNVSAFVKEIPARHLDYIGGSLQSKPAGPARTASQRLPGSRTFGGSRMERAGLEVEKPAPAAKLAEFASGDLVKHPRFGQGKVLSAKPMAGDCFLLVDFPEQGQKRMLARAARLEKIT